MKTQEGIRLLNSYYNWCTNFPFLFFYLITFFPPLYANAIAAAKTPEELCPPGWEINPNKTKCYFHISIPHSWDQSQSICNNLHHSHLAAPSSSQDLILLRNLCNRHSNGSKTPRSHSNACWLGGRASNSSNSSSGFTWNWFGSDDLSQSNFTISTIDNLNHTDHCTLVIHNSSALLAERCNASHEFLCMLHIEDRCHRHHCHKEYFVILLSVSGLILGTTLAVVIWLLAYKRSKRRKRSRKASNPSTSALVPSSWKVFTNEELRSVTKNFSEGNRLIGDAKTGGTYSGVLPDGSRVAVKRLKRSTYQRKKEFYSAIGKVARLHHPNLVAIKGCRFDHGDRFIVYEFVANGPLDRWLHHIPRGGRSLDWSMRMRVATTLAQGIAFLHDKVKPHVVHHDIRASNVLLDEDFGAHLMGVGLSKFVPWEVMHERTKMAATYGYLAPEFVYRNELTTKSDVYSFGVLLLEIVSGRRPTQSVDSVGGWQTIFEWATPLVQSHCYLDLLDPLISDLPEVGVIQKVVELVYCCTQHVPSVRPRMSHVVHQLQQLGMKAASDKTKVGPSSETSTSTTTPVSVLEVEVSN